MSVLGITAAGVTAATGVAGLGAGMFQSWRQNQNNNRNYRLQRDKFNFNQQEAQISRDREDTAMQRKMADMQAAGLHPTLAAGGQGAGAGGMGAPPGGAEGKEMSIMEQAKMGAMLAHLKSEADLNRARADDVRDPLRAKRDQAEIDYTRQREIRLIQEREEALERLELDRENLSLQQAVQAQGMQLIELQLTRFMHDNAIIVNSGMSSYQKNNIVSQVMQAMEVYGSGAFDYALDRVLDQLPSIPNEEEVREGIINFVRTRGGLLGRGIGWIYDNTGSRRNR